MKNLIKIIFILALTAAFSSCTKTETEGFENADVVLKSKIDQPSGIDQITKEESLRDGVRTRDLEDLDDNEGDSITDDDDDDEEGAAKASN